MTVHMHLYLKRKRKSRITPAHSSKANAHLISFHFNLIPIHFPHSSPPNNNHSTLLPFSLISCLFFTFDKQITPPTPSIFPSLPFLLTTFPPFCIVFYIIYIYIYQHVRKREREIITIELLPYSSYLSFTHLICSDACLLVFPSVLLLLVAFTYMTYL